MVAVMTDMASLLRRSTVPFLHSASFGACAPTTALFSSKNPPRFDTFSSACNVLGRTQKRAGGVRSRSGVFCARASVGEDRRDDRKEPQFPPPGELQYFGKLSAGCVAGAILVKYGSLCVPSITSPDINVALTLIFTPCVVSLILLALASVSSPDGNTSKQ